MENSTLVSSIGSQKTVEVLKTLTGVDMPFDVVVDAFHKAESEGKVYCFTDTSKDISYRYYPTDLSSIDGEEVWVFSQSLENGSCLPEGKKWFSTFPIRKSALVQKLLYLSTISIGDIRFKSYLEMNVFLKSVADKVAAEDWSYKFKDTSTLPILKNYIANTFDRLLLEEKILNGEVSGFASVRPIVRYNKKVYFNPGLTDRYYNKTVIVLKPVVEPVPLEGFEDLEYTWYEKARIYSSNECFISNDFNEGDLPTPPRYYEKTSDLLYNPELQINLNDKQILLDGLDKGRILKYRGVYKKAKREDKKKDTFLETVVAEFRTAVQRAQDIAKQDFRFVVPQYRNGEREIQFLLPIYIDRVESYRNSEPDCVLVLKYDTSGRVPNYRAVTILTVNLAYSNARLLSKPNSLWLL